MKIYSFVRFDLLDSVTMKIFILLTVYAIINVYSGIEAAVCNQNIVSCVGPDTPLGLLEQ
jgi:hypothetical protein